jgi:hypothetical protein
VILPSKAALAALAVDSYRLAPQGQVIDAAEDRAVITRSVGWVVVTVRGTANYRGWASDFLILPRLPKAHPDLGIGESGMVDGAVALWAALKPLLDPETPIVFVGHSRGAGEVIWLAALATLDRYTVLYTLALEAPWSAGPVLRDFIAARALAGDQTVNGNDPVPHVPMVPWLVPSVWTVQQIGSPMLLPMACHSITLIAAELLALETAA